MASKRIQVIKIPAKTPPTTSSNPVIPEFPRMPRMYLELLENKDKIRPSMVNKEYDPDEAATVFSWNGEAASTPQQPSTGTGNVNPLDPSVGRAGGVSTGTFRNPGPNSSSTSSSSAASSHTEERSEMDQSDDDELSTSSHDGSSTVSVSDESIHGGGRNDNDHSLSALEEEDEDMTSSTSSRSQHPPRENPSLVGGLAVPPRMTNSPVPPPTYEAFHPSVGVGANPPSSLQAPVSTQSRIRDMLDDKPPPSLSDLERRGEVQTDRTFANLGRIRLGSEEEDELKRELLFKFELLKRSYKDADIPEFTMHSNLDNMNRTYENTVRRMSLDSSVEQYKNFLIGGFMLIEFILGVWLKFDMAGFTQQQILNMSQYDRLLIELGEKSYVPGGSQWPVEIRLLGMILLNSVIFIVSKMLLKKTGSNLVGMMNAMSSLHSTPSMAARPRRKMRGPNITVDDVTSVASSVR